jgi:hypothetical protein
MRYAFPGGTSLLGRGLRPSLISVSAGILSRRLGLATMNKPESPLRLACSRSLVTAALVGGKAVVFEVMETSPDVEEDGLNLNTFSDASEEFCCVTRVTSWDSAQLRVQADREEAFDLAQASLDLTEPTKHDLEVAPELADNALQLGGQDDLLGH